MALGAHSIVGNAQPLRSKVNQLFAFAKEKQQKRHIKSTPRFAFTLREVLSDYLAASDAADVLRIINYSELAWGNSL